MWTCDGQASKISGIKGKILVVDDAPGMVRLIRMCLESEGYRVVCAASAEDALALLRRDKPDLVVLDIKLPGMDGFDCLRLLRRESCVPVVLVSARHAETDRVLGFKLGADDYMVKPFSVHELRARVETHLRRALAAGAAARPAAAVALGALRIDLARHEVAVAGAAVRLTPKEFELLRRLLQADGAVLSRHELLKLAWGHGPDVEIDTRTVDQHVARLRGKLGREAARVVTVHNFGYRLRTDGMRSS
ncbi:MAG: response regulator transcription factor [Elusimicrobia bacterium]|nr:response regulator transcription factor [Elusimicrobiota bacterium]